MSPNKHIEREAKEALGIEIGRGKRVPKDRLKEFEAKVAALKAATPNKRGRVDTIATLATDDEAVEAGEGEAKSESDTEQLDLIKLSGRGRGRGRRGGRGEGRGGSKQLVAAKTLMSLPAGLPFNMGSGAAFMEASTFFQLQQQSYEMEMKRQKDQLELDKQRTAFQLDSMKAAAEVKKTELEIKQQELALQIKELEMLRQKQVVPTTDGPNTGKKDRKLAGLQKLDTEEEEA